MSIVDMFLGFWGGGLHLGHRIGALAWEPGRLARYTETNVQVFVCCVALPPRVLANSSTYWMNYRLEPLHVDMCICMFVCVCVSLCLHCLHSSSMQEHFYPL